MKRGGNGTLARAEGTALVVAAAAAMAFVVSTATAPQARGLQASVPERTTGEQLYRRDCASCHGARGEGSPRGTALTGTGAAGADFMLKTGRMPLVTAEVRRRPTYDEKELNALVDYVASLAPGPAVPELRPAVADAARGGVLYRAQCSQCHGTTGGGTALAFGAIAPPIGQVAPTQVAEAAIVGPGPMPAFSPAVLSADDLNDLAAYVGAIGAEGSTAPRDMGGGRLGEAVVALGVGLAGLVLMATALARKP